MSETGNEVIIDPIVVGYERYGRAVFNVSDEYVADASTTLQRYVAAETTDRVDLVPVDWANLSVTDPLLRARTVIPQFRIDHTADDQPGEFHGWYIGEEFTAHPHPLLMLTPQDVTAIARPVFRG